MEKKDGEIRLRAENVPAASQSTAVDIERFWHASLTAPFPKQVRATVRWQRGEYGEQWIWVWDLLFPSSHLDGVRSHQDLPPSHPLLGSHRSE